ncbi:MAG TPA: helix-turn-helix domain-containing protein [Candidatus Binataceae bacterium]|nr:helix-turn-helix domain-containing protein [Candidatus Binataceae bacterium]
MSHSLVNWIFWANGRSVPIELPEGAACADFEGDGSLAHILATSRERFGLTREAAATECHLQLSYIVMMETGNYDAIPDMLYLLPSFRRYAEFLGLDTNEVTAIFMHDFEASENAVVQVQRLKSSRAIKLPSLRSVLAAGGVAGAVAAIAVAAANLEHRTARITNAPISVKTPATVSTPVVVAIPPPISIASDSAAGGITRFPTPLARTSAKSHHKSKESLRHKRSVRTARHLRSSHRHRRVS